MGKGAKYLTFIKYVIISVYSPHHSSAKELS
jgi:hypothetical protein